MLSERYAKMELHRDAKYRRSRVDLYSPAETAIRNAIIEVEKVGAHPQLTDVVVELDRCQQKLQNFLLNDPGRLVPKHGSGP